MRLIEEADHTSRTHMFKHHTFVGGGTADAKPAHAAEDEAGDEKGTPAGGADEKTPARQASRLSLEGEKVQKARLIEEADHTSRTHMFKHHSFKGGGTADATPAHAAEDEAGDEKGTPAGGADESTIAREAREKRLREDADHFSSASIFKHRSRPPSFKGKDIDNVEDATLAHPPPTAATALDQLIAVLPGLSACTAAHPPTAPDRGFSSVEIKAGLHEDVTVRLPRAATDQSYGFALGEAHSGEMVISKIFPNGLAEGKLKAGDVILRIGQKLVDATHDHDEVVSLLAASLDLTLVVRRTMSVRESMQRDSAHAHAESAPLAFPTHADDHETYEHTGSAGAYTVIKEMASNEIDAKLREARESMEVRVQIKESRVDIKLCDQDDHDCVF